MVPRAIWHTLRERLGLAPYTSARRYRLRIITPACPSDAVLAVALPRSTPFQTIESQRFLLEPLSTARETTFQNLYALFRTTESATAVFEAILCIEPYSIAHHDVMTSDAENRFLHPIHADITSLATQLQRATRNETVQAINKYICTKLRYGNARNDLWSDLDALSEPSVDCGGFDALFVSLCIASGVPARIVSGIWATNGTMHAWAQFQNEDGAWIPVDPSVEQLVAQGRSIKSGRFGYVGSDHLTLSYGCDLTLECDERAYQVPLMQHACALYNDGRVETLETRFECTEL